MIHLVIYSWLLVFISIYIGALGILFLNGMNLVLKYKKKTTHLHSFAKALVYTVNFN